MLLLPVLKPEEGGGGRGGQSGIISRILELPRWDLTPFYPLPDSEECARDVASVVEEIADLTAFFDRCAIGWGTPRSLDEAMVATSRR